MSRSGRLARAALLIVTALAIGIASAADVINGKAVLALALTAASIIAVLTTQE